MRLNITTKLQHTWIQNIGEQGIILGERKDKLYECVKVNKRLWIKNLETGVLEYTPPDFIRLHGRELMIKLAEVVSESGKLEFEDIMKFETHACRLMRKTR